MTVSGEPHSLSLDEFEIVVERLSLFHQLSTEEHAVWESFVITATKHKDSWVLDTNLDHLEIVREITFEVDIFVHNLEGHRVKYSNGFRVFLENV